MLYLMLWWAVPGIVNDWCWFPTASCIWILFRIQATTEVDGAQRSNLMKLAAAAYWRIGQELSQHLDIPIIIHMELIVLGTFKDCLIKLKIPGDYILRLKKKLHHNSFLPSVTVLKAEFGLTCKIFFKPNLRWTRRHRSARFRRFSARSWKLYIWLCGNFRWRQRSAGTKLLWFFNSSENYLYRTCYDCCVCFWWFSCRVWKLKVSVNNFYLFSSFFRTRNQLTSDFQQAIYYSIQLNNVEEKSKVPTEKFSHQASI